MKNKKSVVSLIAGLIGLTLFVFIYITNNLFTVLERAAVMSLKPIKSGVDRSLIHEGVRYGNDSELDVYEAEKKYKDKKPVKAKYPTVIVFHGGFMQGGLNGNYAHVMGVLHRAGYVPVIPQLKSVYGRVLRLFLGDETIKKKQYPLQLLQGVNAIRWAMNNIAKYGGDPEKIILFSTSSGSAISLRLAYDENVLNPEERSRIKAVISLDPLTSLVEKDKDFMDGFIYPGFGSDTAKLEEYSAMNHVSKSSIPLLLIGAEFEPPQIRKSVSDYSIKHTTFGNYVEYYKIRQRTTKSLVFKLGRKNDKAEEYTLSFLYKKLKSG